MGSDIYLNWNGKTEQEQKAQYTGYNITAGKVGYLRASIGMVQENEVLLLLFEEKFWKSNSDKGLPYDFIENFEKMTIIIRKYCNAEIKISEGGKEKVAFGLEILNQLKAEFFDELNQLKAEFFDEIQTDNSDEILLDWAKSVYEFFELGCRLQIEGKNPRVDISW